MKTKQEIYNDSVPKTSRQLMKYMVEPYRWKFGFFFLLTFLGLLGWNASTYVASRLIEDLSINQTVTDSAWVLVGVFAVFRIADETFWRIAELYMGTFKLPMIERLRTMLYSATLRKPHTYFVNSSSGRVGHWINQTTFSSDRVVDNTIWGAWGQTLELVLSAIFLLTVHWSIALIFTVWLILLFSYNSYRGRKFSKLIARQSDETSKVAGTVVDVVTNSTSVKMYNTKLSEPKSLERQQNKIIQEWRKSWRYSVITNTFKGQSAALINGATLALTVWLFSNGTIGIGGLVLFLAYFSSASSALWNLAWNFDEYYRQFGTIQNALDGLNGSDERAGELVDEKSLPVKASLTITNLSFAYPEQPNEHVISKLNLTVDSGQKIGVVGHSGAGKSTLIGLLLGFYDPMSGDIAVNDINISTKDPSFIRSVSSLVPQDTNLFNRTIRENILYARPSANEEELVEALKKAEAYEFVMKLTDGLDTLVGERGVKLSGGQRQRIAIARAILRDAPLLLLDEATSALDSVSEQAIQKALHKLMKGRTAVVIAHRLSTLKHLDKIVVMDKGSIAEQGTHEELLKSGGIYADLWKRQKDGFLVE